MAAGSVASLAHTASARTKRSDPNAGPLTGDRVNAFRAETHPSPKFATDRLRTLLSCLALDEEGVPCEIQCTGGRGVSGALRRFLFDVRRTNDVRKPRLPAKL